MASSPIYTRQQTKLDGTFASDIAVLTVTKSPKPGAVDVPPLGIVQNAQIQFTQQISRIYDVGNGGPSLGAAPDGGRQVAVYFVGGRTQGQATLARVIGPKSAELPKFYKSMSDVCNPVSLTFNFKGGGCDGAVDKTNEAIYNIEDAVLTSIGISVAAQDMIVNESVQLMFANLSLGA